MEGFISHLAVLLLGLFLGGLIMFILGSLRMNGLNDHIDDLKKELREYDIICEEE